MAKSKKANPFAKMEKKAKGKKSKMKASKSGKQSLVDRMEKADGPV